MALKSFNPITPSLRGTVLIDRSDLHKGKPVKALTEGMHSTGGRNHRGVITSRFMGGGHKRRYRTIDFKRSKRDMVGTVELSGGIDPGVPADNGAILGRK